MTKIKLCGLTRECDIECANKLKPDYIGFVFAQKSHRNVSKDTARKLKNLLDDRIKVVGVFVNEPVENVLSLLKDGIIDIAQLHGTEDEIYISNLRKLTDKPIIKAFRIDSESDVVKAQNCSADYVLLDSGTGGTGTTFDWQLVSQINRPYFLAGGLNCDNIVDALTMCKPYAVDVSSGIETNGYKDENKMQNFVFAVREKEDVI